MDRYSMVPARTFVLQTNIQCTACERKIKKLLQSVKGIHKISIDADQGKIEILGTIDPQTVLKLLQKNEKKAELLWDPVRDQNDLKMITRESKSLVKSHSRFNDTDMVTQVQKLSVIEGVESVEVTEKGTMKVNFRKDIKKVQDFDDKDDETCCTRNSHGKCMHKNHENDCDHFTHEPCCPRNRIHCCHGCRPITGDAYMGLHGSTSVSTGIPWPGYKNASAPPAEAVPLYYQQAWPTPDHMTYHPIYSTFSDDNTKSCVIM